MRNLTKAEQKRNEKNIKEIDEILQKLETELRKMQALKKSLEEEIKSGYTYRE